MALEWRNKWRRKAEFINIFLPGKKLLVFDVETTGLSEESKIIQFSAVLYNIQSNFSLKEENVMDMYINPQEKLSDKIVEITGITDELLANAKTQYEVSDEIFNMLNSADILAGYNVGFDLGRVEKMASITGNHLYMKQYMDVCEMARDFIEKNEIEQHKLGNVVKYLFPDETFLFHDSLEDVKATAKVLETLMKKYITLPKEEGKLPVHLEKAHLFINPKKASMQRIVLTLSVGSDGDIFYDIPGHYWSCKSSASAKKLFKQIDMCDLERQMYCKYVNPFDYSGIDDLAKSWLKFRRDNRKK